MSGEDTSGRTLTRYFLVAVNVPTDKDSHVYPRFTQEDNDPVVGRAELRISLGYHDDVPNTGALETHIFELTGEHTERLLQDFQSANEVTHIASRSFEGTDESYMSDGTSVSPLTLGSPHSVNV